MITQQQKIVLGTEDTDSENNSFQFRAAGESPREPIGSVRHREDRRKTEGVL